MSDPEEKVARELLITRLIQGNNDEKRIAAFDLGELTFEPDFDPTPVLFRTLVETDDETLCVEAAFALAKMREKGLPWIIKGLASEIHHVRYACAHALRYYGGSWAVEAVPCLRDMIRNSSPEIRIEAVGAIGSIGSPAAEAVPEIVPEIASYIREDIETSAACLIALRNLGASAKSAIPALIELIQSTHDIRRSLALRTFAEIESSPNEEQIAAILSIRNYNNDLAILEPLVDILASYCRDRPDRVRQLDSALDTSGEPLDIALAVALKITGPLSSKADSFIKQALRTSDLNRRQLMRALLSYAYSSNRPV